MNRGLWDRFMIMLMGVVLYFGATELWANPHSEDATRYIFASGLAVVVIVLKIKALRKSNSASE